MSLIADLRAWQELLREDACFTHLSSAVARGWVLPQLPEVLPIWIAQTYGQNATTRPGTIAMRRRTATPFEVVDGLRLALPAETLVDCAQDLALLDLVVLLDGALHSGAVELTDLAAAATQRRRGAPALREALRWCNGRAESAWETPLRILHEACGIRVEPQYVVRNHLGGFIARADLRVCGTRELPEYDGAGHRSAAQHRRNLERERGLADAGFVRRGYTAADLANQPHLVLIAACRALGRPFDFGLMKPWWPLWEQSCFTEQGRTALGARVARKTAGTEGRPRRRRAPQPAVCDAEME